VADAAKLKAVVAQTTQSSGTLCSMIGAWKLLAIFFGFSPNVLKLDCWAGEDYFYFDSKAVRFFCDYFPTPFFTGCT